MKPILFILILITMGISSFGQKEVPKTWKHGMKLKSSYGGGMTQYSYKLEISDSISHLDVTGDSGDQKHYERKFTQRELNDILAFLAKYNFHKIESEDVGPMDDKGSESVLLTWDYEVIGASEGSSSRIIDQYRVDFNTITDYVKGLF